MAPSPAEDMAPSPPPLRFMPTQEPTPLRPAVEALIEPWRAADTTPPFSTAELIVFAFVMTETKKMSESQIRAWISQTFPVYSNRPNTLLERFEAIVRPREWRDPKSTAIHAPDLDKILYDFDLPMETRFFCRKSRDLVLSISWSATRIFLGLEPDRSGVFPFMRLAAELREKVYKMLLVYPKDKSMGLERALRGLEVSPGVKEADHQMTRLSVPDPGKTFSILYVSKQVHGEALPIFYGHNRFRYPLLNSIDFSFMFMTKNAIQGLRHLQLNTEIYGGRSELGETITDLAQWLPELQLTSLILYCRKWRGWPDELGTDYDQLDEADRRVLNETAGAMELVSLARRTENLRIEGEGVFKDWLIEKLGDKVINTEKSSGEDVSGA